MVRPPAQELAEQSPQELAEQSPQLAEHGIVELAAAHQQPSGFKACVEAVYNRCVIVHTSLFLSLLRAAHTHVNFQQSGYNCRVC